MADKNRKMPNPTAENLATLKENLQLFTISQLAQDYGVSSRLLHYYAQKHNVPIPEPHIRAANRVKYIESALDDGFSHAEIRKELVLNTHQYASLCRRTRQNRTKRTDTSKQARALPFDASEKKDTLANRLAFAMKQTNTNVGQLAFAAGCSDQTILNILQSHGVMLNNGNTLLGIAIALNVELDWLVDNKIESRTGKVTNHPITSKRPGARHMKAPNVQ
jgi:DNA-binding transcriptional MerR regulator